MRKKYSSGLVITLTVSLMQAGVHSEEIPARGPIPFAAYDKNGDGVISEDEFYSVREARMSKRMDAGNAVRGTANAPAFSDFDTDKDGLVNPDEPVTGQQARMQDDGCIEMGQGRGMGRNRPDFSDYDLDGDGNIWEAEFYEARNNRISERAKQGYPMRNLANAPSFTDIDSDRDGKISPEEFAAHQAQCRGL